MAEPLNGRAIGIGVAVGVGASLAYGVVWHALGVAAMVGDGRLSLAVAMLLVYSIGALIDIATGATAGALARVRGALHGLVAGAIAAVLSPVVSIAMMLVQQGGTLPVAVSDFLWSVAPASIAGVALATVSGGLAARIAARRAVRAA